MNLVERYKGDDIEVTVNQKDEDSMILVSFKKNTDVGSALLANKNCIKKYLETNDIIFENLKIITE